MLRDEGKPNRGTHLHLQVFLLSALAQPIAAGHHPTQIVPKSAYVGHRHRLSSAIGAADAEEAPAKTADVPLQACLSSVIINARPAILQDARSPLARYP
mmetsp:Transcript_369/g.1574  ORF Transcript_369/g.1574 Transcript_369/m.1574 type:complete len:99 (+) Transcript_369:1287-1583(+)